MKPISMVIALLLLGGSFVWTHAGEPQVDGKALYASKCAMCHGADGVAKAMGKGSKNFNDPAFALTTDEIQKVTQEGKNKMPKFASKLKPEEVHAIAEYVKTFGCKK